MSWQIIHIGNPAKLSVQHGNLLLQQDQQEEVVIPASEISAIVIENQQVTLTAGVMGLCAKNNIVVFFSDDLHLPAGAYYPFHQHSRFCRHAHQQISWSQPFKNRLWQLIIQQKIMNQSRVLAIHHGKENKLLDRLAKLVTSGDKDNLEAQAARYYWQQLFNDFNRNSISDIRNSALNYGYSILRSAIARNLSAHGLLPVFGIKHHNELNAYNLADDIIEPYRPIVDAWVTQNQLILYADTELARKHKIELVKLLNQPVVLAEQQMTVQTGIALTCSSLLKAIQDKNPKLIHLPQL